MSIAWRLVIIGAILVAPHIQSSWGLVAGIILTAWGIYEHVIDMRNKNERHMPPKVG